MSKYTMNDFLRDATNIFGDRYDYSKVEFTTKRSNIKIGCSKHGTFEKQLDKHLKGEGCQKCKREKKSKYKLDDFLKDATNIFGDLYNYSKVEFVNKESIITIVCKKHGVFAKQLDKHLKGRGCQKCVREEKTYTTEIFIEKANKVFNNKYDYSITKYTGSQYDVDIICLNHGKFTIRANLHLYGHGCPEKNCEQNVNNMRITKYNVIEKFREKHGDKYDYSQVEFKSSNNNVVIICKSHGSFLLTPSLHIKGYKCKQCNIQNIQLKAFDKFVKQSQQKYGDLYDYSKVVWINKTTEIKIKCNKHNIEFSQTPQSHLKYSCCIECIEHIKKPDIQSTKNITKKPSTKTVPKNSTKIPAKNKQPVIQLSTEEFIKICSEIHQNKYDYSKTEYIKKTSKVSIICRVHGMFEQIPRSHLLGHGCAKCAHDELGLTKRLSPQTVIEMFRKIHGDMYDYSMMNYIGMHIEITIICPDHGPFSQTPHHHIYSENKCSFCSNKVSKGEQKIITILDEFNVSYIHQKKFEDCKNIFCLSFDFYIEEYNLIIEFDGKQHFEPVPYFGGEETFEKQKQRDEIKNNYCKEKNINLLRIRYDENIRDKLKLYF
jgi:very-short-patch-repair endonuclease